MGERLIHDAPYEVVNEDGTITVLQGNPRYCPQEHEHEPHQFVYAYLDKNDNVVRGSYRCFGDPAPWVTDSEAKSDGE